ncbi:MAG: cyclic pyranopterin monophosphate synthase MoaC [Blastocatellia bacterium]|nr:cyclic pyranopterin monophosphate synthase MoaC [Blastocatellia bacterium]
MTEFSHINREGQAEMVDVGHKPTSARRAVASAKLLVSENLLQALREKAIPKGDPFETARIAGIMAAKQTSNLIPLCHPLPISYANVEIEIQKDGVYLTATVSTQAPTGVEMEALTAVSVAALTVYDMCKAIDKGIVITDLRLESKQGGKSGDWTRESYEQGRRQT